jgi:hypothetical protein
LVPNAKVKIVYCGLAAKAPLESVLLTQSRALGAIASNTSERLHKLGLRFACSTRAEGVSVEGIQRAHVGHPRPH